MASDRHQLATFLTACCLTFVNLAFDIGLDGLEECLQGSVGRLQAFLDTFAEATRRRP